MIVRLDSPNEGARNRWASERGSTELERQSMVSVASELSCLLASSAQYRLVVVVVAASLATFEFARDGGRRHAQREADRVSKSQRASDEEDSPASAMFCSHVWS